tara:strand:+ start:535 stop:2205 length:1671 start_codon:yes stop_codon:yes gene_type:complete
MAIQPPTPKGPSNQTKLGATPGTQQVAQKNVSGGGFNPNMPVGAQLAKQAASSYQQSLLPGGTAAKGSGVTGGALPTPTGTPGTALKGPPGSSLPAATSGTPATGRPVVSQGTADPTKGYNIFSGMDPQQIQKMNEDMGLSNLFKGKRPEQEEDLGEPKSILLMQQTSDPAPDWWTGTQEDWDDLADSEKAWYKTNQPIQEKFDELEEGVQKDTYEAEDYEFGSGSIGDVSGEVKSAMEEGDSAVESLKALADAGPGTVDDYQGVNDDLGGTNIEAIEDAVEAWAFESQGDAIGLDPYKKQAAMDQLDAKYATHLQQVLAGLDRQAAMAGTFGSAAHTMNINAAISGAMQQMASEFMELEKMDLEAVETDYAEQFSQMMGISEVYTNMENLGMQLETLNQAAYKMGLDKFAQEIAAYIATGETTNAVIAANQKEIDQLLQLGILDVNAFTAEANAKQAEIALEQASDTLALQYEKQVMDAAILFGEKLAAEMDGYMTILKETLSGPELKNSYQMILGFFAEAQEKLAAGADYDEVMEILNDAIGDYFNSVYADPPG